MSRWVSSVAWKHIKRHSAIGMPLCMFHIIYFLCISSYYCCSHLSIVIFIFFKLAFFQVILQLLVPDRIQPVKTIRSICRTRGWQLDDLPA